MLKPSPGGHSNTSVVHMLDQRNMKKGFFFEPEHDLRESRLGSKRACFQEKESFLNSIREHLGVIFKLVYSTIYVPKKNLV